ncbi:MAG: elongation factor Ts [Clostridia bacterium]|nr:elongation factor Ts [Clostridia bacterium]
MISASAVKDLREKTGCGMMDCKKALTEANGDMERAIELLREKGLAAAAKKAGRIAAEGIVTAVVDGATGVVLEINSETDFVGKNAEFQKFVSDVAELIIKKNPADVDALYAEALEGKTVREVLNDKIATIGENMNIRRFERYEGVLEAYIHGGGRIGVLVQFSLEDESKKDAPEFKTFARDMAMQVAAAIPSYVRKEEVPAEVVEKEKEILTAQALNEGKPANIVEKMVVGRINKFYKEVCIVDQAFIKDPDKSVTALMKEVSTAIGTKIDIVKFARFEKGEGLEKKEDNFAEEVASMTK